MVNTPKLNRELMTAGLTIPVVSVGWRGPRDEPNATYLTAPDGSTVVRLVWPRSPSAADVAKSAQVIAAHDGTPTMPLATARLILQASASAVSPQQRASAQTVVDVAAQDALASGQNQP